MSPLKAFQDALRQSPENVPLLLLYGRACLEDLQFDDAVASFQKAADLDPRNPDAHIGLARALLVNGQPSQAAVRLEVVLRQDPSCAPAHLMMSRLLLAESDLDRAREHFQRAAQLDPALNDPGLERELGWTLADARRAPASGTLPDWLAAAPGEPSPSQAAAPAFGEPPASLSGPDQDDDWLLDDPPFDWRPETFFAVGDPERDRFTFEDIGGLEDVKEEIRRKIIHPLQQPEMNRAYGRAVGGGILFYGPPGCGKTLLLRAVAGEAPCNYLAVGLHEIFDPYYGSTERNLHQAFETARLNSPCVLVLDGFDSLGQDRRQARESQMRNVVNQMLHEMDSLRAGQHRVLVLAATSQPWTLDPALTRPGRFDQSIFIAPPDLDTRAAILERLISERPVGRCQVAELAKATEGFSGADLCWVMDRAAELAMGEAIRTGIPVPITSALLKSVAASHTPTTQDWLAGASSAQEDPVAARTWLTSEVRRIMAERGSRR